MKDAIALENLATTLKKFGGRFVTPFSYATLYLRRKGNKGTVHT